MPIQISQIIRRERKVLREFHFAALRTFRNMKCVNFEQSEAQNKGIPNIV